VIKRDNKLEILIKLFLCISYGKVLRACLLCLRSVCKMVGTVLESDTKW
jgi:hypothetical protein